VSTSLGVPIDGFKLGGGMASGDGRLLEMFGVRRGDPPGMSSTNTLPVGGRAGDSDEASPSDCRGAAASRCKFSSS